MLSPFAPERSPEEEELQQKKTRLDALQADLADRELELASCYADLLQFEKRYLEIVGRPYAVLDDLRARIAEAVASRNPQNQTQRADAEAARAKAQESAHAAGVDETSAQTDNDAASRFLAKEGRPESLRVVYRQAAKMLHPDLTLDPDEKEKRHRLMAEVNDAYARGDEKRIRDILRDWHASPENVQGDGAGVELIRLIRKIAQVEKRLKAIAAEMEAMRDSELFKLRRSVDEAKASGRDLLTELAESVNREIHKAQEELKRAQVGAA